MDDLIKIIIGAFFVIAWIAGNIWEKQKATAKAAPPPLPPVDLEPAAPAKKVDDLQDFLAQLRRRTGEPEMRTPDELRPASQEVKRVEAPKPTPPVKPAKSKKKKASANGEPTLSRAAADIASLMPEAAVQLTALSPAAIAPTVSISRRKSATAREVVRLLKSPSSLATAFVLQEILGEPLAKRKRRAK
jgi:hypothetical protein